MLEVYRSGHDSCQSTAIPIDDFVKLKMTHDTKIIWITASIIMNKYNVQLLEYLYNFTDCIK